MVSQTGAHRAAPRHSAAGRRECSLGPDGVLGIQGAAHAQFRRAEDSCLIVRSQKKKKSRSLIRVSLFQVHPISRDVKGLGRYKSRSLVRLQLEDELRVQVGCSVRVRDGPGPISLKGMLRGQVSFAWESSKPLYMWRGDVSI